MIFIGNINMEIKQIDTVFSVCEISDLSPNEWETYILLSQQNR